MPPGRSVVVLAAVIGAAMAAGLAACAGGGPDGTPVAHPTLRVGVAFYPIEEIVRTVGDGTVEVITLVPPGQSAHDYEPTPKQAADLDAVDIVFYLGGGFQPGVEKAIASLPARVARVDLLDDVTLLPVTDQLAGVDGETDGETLGDGNDPHVWLDPTNMVTMTERVRRTLGDADPAAADVYDTRAATYTAALTALDAAFAAALADCVSPVIVTSHRSFEYLAHRYGLTQLPIAGISQTEEPSAKTLDAIAEAARQLGVTTIYFEEHLPPELARTVADEIGATTDVLGPLETLSKDQLAAGETYLSVMESNLTRLERGLGCS